MTFLGACITRRLLSDIRTSRVAPRLPAPASQRHHTTIYQKLSLEHRSNPNEERDLERFIDKLTYVLRRHAGRELGLENGDDDYVSLELLLNHPEFRETSIPVLQKVINNDRKHRFALRYKPTNNKGCWWIRARRWNESLRYMKPIMYAKGPPQAVFRTTQEEWQTNISRSGIPRKENEYISLDCCIPTDTYLHDLKPREELFIFVDVDKCQRHGMQFFAATPPPQPLAQPTAILTMGNEYGYIPPEFFVHVDRTTVNKRLIWGDEDPTMQRVLSKFLSKTEEEHTRQTFIRPPHANINGFVVFPHLGKKAHPETLEEAKLILGKT